MNIDYVGLKSYKSRHFLAATEGLLPPTGKISSSGYRNQRFTHVSLSTMKFILSI